MTESERPFASPEATRVEQELELAARLTHVLTERAKGVPVVEIAEKLGLHRNSVYAMIRDAVEEARQRNVDLVEEMFLVHQERLERLFRKVQALIDAMEGFDDRMVRVAILILERQARLLGLDKEKERNSDRDKYSWLENATQDELVREAELRGLRVPEKFKLPVSVRGARAADPD